jgi:redox-sensitive bicupin YhaK (pirin superfamily)
MIQIRKSDERGHANHGWLDSFHTFSFADYYDPHFMGFRTLRVINEDRVAPAQGFDPHSHRDMEIVTYVIEGELEHKDSMGTGSVILPGDVQRMSAGTGVTHSEYNHSKSKEVHLLQIWILPEKKSTNPSYEQKSFTDAQKKDRLLLVGSSDGRQGSVTIHQDVSLYSGILSPKKELDFELKKDRSAWVQLVKGELNINGQWLQAGDGAAVSGEAVLKLHAREKSELLVFDLP